MSLEQIRESLPDYARDIRLNLSSVLTPQGAPGLTEKQIASIALASAIAARNVEFAPAGRLRLLWFGHVTNLRYLDHCMNALVGFAAERPCRLTIVTEDAFGAREVTKAIDTRFSPFLRARFVEWSSEAMTEALRECDLVLIPSDPSDPSKAGVSANRVAEVLRAGRFPVASPLPAYLPFSEAAWLGDDLIEGVRWALGNQGEVRARVRRGQSLVTEKLSPERIGRQWRELLEDLARAHS